VNLSWNPSTSQVVGYNVYRSNQSGGPYGRINAALDPNTAYTDGSVLGGQTYYYATTAVNSQGQESTYSNLSQAVIP
jgi:fibronectin type 3 domain-containing protein